ncbi:MAG: pentapeptide repeat-containing protein [Methylococcaceae bacterium]|nr:pentapeptide repeat-containing protein [Methylococcaceae bacterium]
MTSNPKNFQGRSFRNDENLVNANFSGAKLQGADFRGLDLTGANFSGAVTGIFWLHKVLKTLLALLLGVASELLSAISILFLVLTLTGVSWINGDETLIAIVIYLLLSFGSVLLALRRRNWLLAWVWQLSFILMVLAGAVLGAGVGNDMLLGGVSLNLVRTLAEKIAGVVAVAVAIAGSIAISGAVAGAAPLTLALVFALPLWFMAVLMLPNSIAISVATAPVLTAAFGFYLNRRCLKHEEAMLLPLRRLYLVFRHWGSTDFRGATLDNTDFTAAKLGQARFGGAELIRCHWQNAEDLHLADFRGTIMETRALRLLLSQGDVGAKDFSRCNLRGGRLSGLDLRGVNFYHADLSQADFSHSDLRDSNLSEATALASNFTDANFTGAILENWNVDKHTDFTGAKADFVYLRRDRSEPNPPQGQFGPGDFAKLYQEIANTVDFIAHTPEELQALLLAIESIKRQGGTIFLQQMERKNDSVVLRVQSEQPETIDKAAIYAEVEKQKQSEMQAIDQRHAQTLLEKDLYHSQELRAVEKENKDLLAQLLQNVTAKPNAPITYENNFMTQDHSRRIENSTLNHSNAALGDGNHQSLHIEQLPDGDVKAMLQQLKQLIDNAPLRKGDRDNLENEVNKLATSAAATPLAKSEISKSITTLKDLTSIFKDLPQMSAQYGTLLAELLQMFN